MAAPDATSPDPSGSAEPDDVPDTPHADAALDAQGHEPPKPLFEFHEAFTFDRIFTQRESALAKDLQAYARAGESPHQAALRKALDVGFQRLGSIALALETYPSLIANDQLGDRQRSLDTLMEALLSAAGHALEWTLPTKAVLSRAFGIAKVNFWTSLDHVLRPAKGETEEPLHRGIEDAIEEAVYTRLAEELYGSFVGSQTLDDDLRRTAIDHVTDLWEGRVRFATYRFCPILRSAWAARTRAPRVFGTLMGTSELIQLLFADCDERFLDVFTAQDSNEGMIQAFEEFLFDIPFESIEAVRAYMAENDLTCVGPQEVAEHLGFPTGQMRPLIGGAKALYSSFRRRRVKAQYRTSMEVPGPQRTAESYVLEALLRTEIQKGPSA